MSKDLSIGENSGSNYINFSIEKEKGVDKEKKTRQLAKDTLSQSRRTITQTKSIDATVKKDSDKLKSQDKTTRNIFKKKFLSKKEAAPTLSETDPRQLSLSSKGKGPAFGEADLSSKANSIITGFSTVQKIHRDINTHKKLIANKKEEIRKTENERIGLEERYEHQSSLLESQVNASDEYKKGMKKQLTEIKTVIDSLSNKLSDGGQLAKELDGLHRGHNELQLTALNFRLSLAKQHQDYEPRDDINRLAHPKKTLESKREILRLKLAAPTKTSEEELHQKGLAGEIETIDGLIDEIERKIEILRSTASVNEDQKNLEVSLKSLKEEYANDPADLDLSDELDRALHQSGRPPSKEQPPPGINRIEELKTAYYGKPADKATRHLLAWALIEQGVLPERRQANSTRRVDEAEELLIAEMAKILSENPDKGTLKRIGQGAGSSYLLGVENNSGFLPMLVIKPIDEQPGGSNHSDDQQKDLALERQVLYGGAKGEIMRDYVRLNGPFSDTMAAIGKLTHPDFSYLDGVAIPKDCLIIRYESNDGSMEDFFELDGRIISDEEKATIAHKRTEYRLSDEEFIGDLLARSSEKAQCTLERFIIGDITKRGLDSNIGNVLLSGKTDNGATVAITDFRMIDGGASSAETHLDETYSTSLIENPPFWGYYEKATSLEPSWNAETLQFLNAIDIDKELDRDRMLFAAQGVHYSRNAQRLDKQSFRLVKALMPADSPPVTLRQLAAYTRSGEIEKNLDKIESIGDDELLGYIESLNLK